MFQSKTRPPLIILNLTFWRLWWDISELYNSARWFVLCGNYDQTQFCFSFPFGEYFHRISRRLVVKVATVRDVLWRLHGWLGGAGGGAGGGRGWRPGEGGRDVRRLEIISLPLTGTGDGEDGRVRQLYNLRTFLRLGFLFLF